MPEFTRTDLHNIKRACYRMAVEHQEQELLDYSEGDTQGEEFNKAQKEIYQELYDRIIWLLDMVY